MTNSIDQSNIQKTMVQPEKEKVEIKKKDRKTQAVFQAREMPQIPMTTSEKCWLAAKITVLTVLFPLGLAYLAWKVTAWVIGKILFTCILKQALLPAAFLYQWENFDTFYRYINNSETQSLIQAKTPDNCLLRGLIAWNKAEDKKTFEAWDGKGKLQLKNQKFILHVSPNAECYQKGAQQAESDADLFEVNILRFNYRQVADSEGVFTSAKDLVVDAHTMYTYLTDHLGVPTENILVQGCSIGGGVASQLETKGILIERSFSSLSGFVPGNAESAIRKDLSAGNETGKAQKLKKSEEVTLTRRTWARRVGSFMRFFAHQVLSAVNNELDTVEGLKRLQAKKAKVMLATGSLDSMMRNGGSAYSGLKRQLDGYVKIDPVLSQKFKKMEKKNDTDEFSQEYEQYKKNEELKKSIINFKFKKAGHNDSLREDKDTYVQLLVAVMKYFQK